MQSYDIYYTLLFITLFWFFYLFGKNFSVEYLYNIYGNTKHKIS